MGLKVSIYLGLFPILEHLASALQLLGFRHALLYPTLKLILTAPNIYIEKKRGGGINVVNLTVVNLGEDPEVCCLLVQVFL